jgi:hypothetical protein
MLWNMEPTAKLREITTPFATKGTLPPKTMLWRPKGNQKRINTSLYWRQAVDDLK